MTAKAVIAQAKNLPVEARRRVFEAIEDSLLDDDPCFGLTAEQRRELERRWREHRRRPQRAIPWEVVEQRLRALLR